MPDSGPYRPCAKSVTIFFMNDVEYRMIENCEIEIPPPFCLVIFGASGDLTGRKIIPSLYKLDRDKLLSEQFLVLGVARTEMADADFRDQMKDSLKDAFPEDFVEKTWKEFSQKLHYMSIDYDDPRSYTALKRKIISIKEKYGDIRNCVFYLAITPKVYETIISNLGSSGLASEDEGFTHIVVEKPIGWDLESARRLNTILRGSFQEKQVFRMDHYLAKETVQNILMFRFANSIFEPLWNRRYIDHVQITVTETLGVGHRGGYYDKAGVIRDMFQNHIFQLLALTAMEPPALFEAERVRDEKVKVFRSVRPFPLDRLKDVLVLGQYGKGRIAEKEVVGYREEPKIPGDSITPTYAALKVFIDNWRWNGVPFYLRSGKRLKKKKSEISIHYRHVPHLMFAHAMAEDIEPNTLVLRIQPDEGIDLNFQAKTPGSRVCLNPVAMDFAYQKIFSLTAYERILLDCMRGDQMLFVRDDGVEQTWSLLTPVLEKLEKDKDIKDFPKYEAGSDGPEEAELLPKKDGREWRPL